MSRNLSVDVCIIGAGPAGVSCAIWLKQLGFSVVLVDKNNRCGGLQLSNPFTNTWIATSADAMGEDIVEALNRNVEKHRIQRRLGVSAIASFMATDGLYTTTLSDHEFINSRFIVLAGGSSPKTGGFASRLSVTIGPGPKIANTNFRGGRVAILGGGDSAFENYHFAMQRGADEVTIFARSVRARKQMVDSVPAESVVTGKYHVTNNGRTVNGTNFDHTLVLYGFEASRDTTLGLPVAFKPDGFVDTDEECRTSVERVFAIGEIAQRAHPCCVTAMADGVIAAKAIQRELENTNGGAIKGVARRVLNVISGVRIGAMD